MTKTSHSTPFGVVAKHFYSRKFHLRLSKFKSFRLAKRYTTKILKEPDFLHTEKDFIQGKAFIRDANYLILGQVPPHNFMPSGKVNIQFDSKLLSDSMIIYMEQIFNHIGHVKNTKNRIVVLWLPKNFDNIKRLLDNNEFTHDALAISTTVFWRKSNEPSYKTKSIQVEPGKITDCKITW